VRTRDDVCHTENPEASVRQFRLFHVVAAAMAQATVTAVGFAQPVWAESRGTPSVFVPIAPCRLLETRSGSENIGARSTPLGPGELALIGL